MSESQHTPGPWVPAKAANGQWLVKRDSNDETVARIARWERSIDAADAVLIAEAPEMFRALKAVLACDEFERINPGLLHRIRSLVLHVEEFEASDPSDEPSK